MNPDPALRLFVALPLPADQRAELADLVDPSELPQARKTHPDQLHLTLRFLGTVSAQLGEEVRHQARSIRLPQLALQTAGAGCFPNPRHCRVLWAGLQGDLDPLRHLYTMICSRLDSLPVQQENAPFHPHITLARFRFSPPPPKIGDWIERHRGFSGTRFVTTHFVVYSSTLAPHSPIHTPLEIVPLLER